MQWRTLGRILGGGASLLFWKHYITHFNCFRTKDYCLPKYWGPSPPPSPPPPPPVSATATMYRSNVEKKQRKLAEVHSKYNKTIIRYLFIILLTFRRGIQGLHTKAFVFDLSSPYSVYVAQWIGRVTPNVVGAGSIPPWSRLRICNWVAPLWLVFVLHNNYCLID